VDIRDLTPDDAKALLNAKYIVAPHIDQIPDPQLRCQMSDWSVNSGPEVPIRALQHILGVERDGELGPVTLAALAQRDPKDINNRLATYRIAFLYDIVKANPRLAKFQRGWINRAKSFLLA